MEHRLALSAALLIAVGGSGGSATGIPDFGANEALSAQAMAALDPTRAGRLACRGLDASGSTLGDRLKLAEKMAQDGAAGAGEGSMGLYPGLAATDLPLGDIDPLARRYFEQGLALAYGFNHRAAIRSFRHAQRIDPDCTMCWWGEAMANGPNINAAMNDEQNRAALAALDKARSLSAGADPLVAALVEAQSRRYSADAASDRAALDADYADAMLALARQAPGSDDLAVLAAEAAMNTTPWNYWNLESGSARPRIPQAVALIETVMARTPRHPQAAHLYIHLLELPEPARAEAAADRLRDSRPAALGHLVHMPSHIYYRIGRYADSLAVNRDAVAADEAYLARAGGDPMVRFGYYPHNVHFLLTSAQMLGDVNTVASQAARLQSILDVDTGRALPWVQAIYAAPFFAQAQYGSAAAILALTQQAHPLDYVEAMRHYARAVAHAERGDEDGFAGELAALQGLAGSPGAASMEGDGFPAPLIIRLSAEVAQGRMAMKRGHPETAIGHFAAATEMQKAIPYMEPPYWYYPVSQSLGAAYFQAGRYEDARQAFRAALFEAPNSALALYGLARTERRLGHGPEAMAAQAAFDGLWLGDDRWLDMTRI